MKIKKLTRRQFHLPMHCKTKRQLHTQQEEEDDVGQWAQGNSMIPQLWEVEKRRRKRKKEKNRAKRMRQTGTCGPAPIFQIIQSSLFTL